MTLPMLVNDQVDLQGRSVQEIRKSGLRVFVQHRRYYTVDIGGKEALVGPFTKSEAENFGYSGRNIWGRGGSTDVEIYNGDTLIAQGGAICSKKDQFVRKYGRNKALGRALSKILRH